MSEHTHRASNRKAVLEHLFLGELLKYLWVRGIHDVELLRPSVDAAGYDVVIECRGIVRHIRLRFSKTKATAASQNIHVALANKPSGCVVWIFFDEETIQLGPFLWFGSEPGEPLPGLAEFKPAKHTKGNAEGVKKERNSLREVRKGAFERVESIADLAQRLFGLD